MLTESSRSARELLHSALGLLSQEDSLVAAAMIAGAIEVLDRNITPARRVQAVGLPQRMRRASAQHSCRSCA